MIGTKVVEEVDSSVNGTIKVIKSLGFGTYIQVEGVTQSGGVVTDVWRTTLKKLRTKEIKNCLVLGLGGGSAAKLVRKYWPEAKITGVDIDPVMVELGREYLGLDKVQVKVQIQDAYRYTKYNIQNTKFDLILVDLYIGDKVPKEFEKDDFIKLTSKLLSKEGVVVFNRLFYGDKRPQAVRFGQKLQKYFSKVDAFYPEANIMYICHHRVGTKDNSQIPIRLLSLSFKIAGSSFTLTTIQGISG